MGSEMCIRDRADDVHIPAGWSVPMISYVDVRKLPGVDMFDAINGCLYGNRGSSEEVFMWVNRFNDVTSLTYLYPDTEIAHSSVRTYAERFIEILTDVATHGDHTPATPVLTG